MHPVPCRDVHVFVAQRKQLVAGEPPDDRRGGGLRSALPEAELADQTHALRIAEPSTEPQLVLDHAAPERNATQDGRVPRPAEQVDLVGAVETA